MALYLLHEGRDRQPVGVWRSPTDYYYPPSQEAKQNYGEAVMENMGTDVTWDDWIEGLASKFPGPKDMWDTYEADGTLELPEVLSEAQSNTGYSDH